MSEEVYNDCGEASRVATTIHDQEKPRHSRLLGPDGEPLPYRVEKIGFDLSRRRDAAKSSKR